jgi:hypothetical protein
MGSDHDAREDDGHGSAAALHRQYQAFATLTSGDEIDREGVRHARVHPHVRDALGDRSLAGPRRSAAIVAEGEVCFGRRRLDGSR